MDFLLIPLGIIAFGLGIVLLGAMIYAAFDALKRYHREGKTPVGVIIVLWIIIPIIVVIIYALSGHVIKFDFRGGPY